MADSETEKRQDVVADADHTTEATTSPDGRRFAYVRRDQGVAEILVSPFPPAGSSGGVKVANGDFPLWILEDELVFLQGDTLMSLHMVAESPYSRGEAREIVQGPYFEPRDSRRPYDYDPIGDRFLVVRNRSSPRTLVLVQGLDAEIETLFADSR